MSAMSDLIAMKDSLSKNSIVMAQLSKAAKYIRKRLILTGKVEIQRLSYGYNIVGDYEQVFILPDVFDVIFHILQQDMVYTDKDDIVSKTQNIVPLEQNTIIFTYKVNEKTEE